MTDWNHTYIHTQRGENQEDEEEEVREKKMEEAPNGQINSLDKGLKEEENFRFFTKSWSLKWMAPIWRQDECYSTWQEIERGGIYFFGTGSWFLICTINPGFKKEEEENTRNVSSRSFFLSLSSVRNYPSVTDCNHHASVLKKKGRRSTLDCDSRVHIVIVI